MERKSRQISQTPQENAPDESADFDRASGMSDFDRDALAESTFAIQSIAGRCESNAEALQVLLDQIAEIHGAVIGQEIVADQARLPQQLSSDSPASESPASESTELNQLRDQIFDLEGLVQQLEQQNGDLASRLASHNVEASVRTGNASSDETLSWEERKKLMLQQMEEDSYDAETFIEQFCESGDGESMDPIQYVDQLQDELDRRNGELEDRRQQIQELQHLLDQQSETRNGGIAIGAAAITQMFDADELVREERERLQHMQEEWEEKFRQAEIEASLERAKLSRDRQELARKMAEMEEQLAHAKRESRQTEAGENGTSRRWLAKLGLAENGA